MTTYRNLIGGEWVVSTSARRFTNINPANTDDIIGEAVSYTHLTLPTNREV